MRQILREYELFCLEHDLTIESDKNVLQRRLCSFYGARASQVATHPRSAQAPVLLTLRDWDQGRHLHA